MPKMSKAMMKLRRSILHHVESHSAAPSFPLEIFVGVSGGADSLALLGAVNKTFINSDSVKVTAIIVDHNLQKGSGEISQRAERDARLLGVDSFIHEKADITFTRNGLESDARDARYEIFEKILEGSPNGILLLGHTLDDQAEQMMMALSRVSGMKTLTGIPSVRGRIIRPMLGIRGSALDTGLWREDTEKLCEEFGVEPWNDPMNLDKDILRVKTRIDVLPELEKVYGKGFKKNLVRTADSLSLDLEVMENLSEEVYEGSVEEDDETLSIADLKGFSKHKSSVRRSVIKRICDEVSDELIGTRHIEAVESIALSQKGGTALDLPGMTVRRVKGSLKFEKI